MTGPVETAARALHVGCQSCDGDGTVRDWVLGGYDVYQCESLAQLEDVLAQGFEDAHAAGWRVVRTEPAGLWEDPRYGGPYNEDERRPPDAYELFAITDEWLPACPGDPDPEPRGGPS